MPQTYNLSNLDWVVAGFTPYYWQINPIPDIRTTQHAEIAAVPARIPGSVQSALLAAGLIPDWNLGLNARQCEWVENRHWIFQADLPDDWGAPGETLRLHCLGLDDRGWVLLNGQILARFHNAFLPLSVDFTAAWLPTGNRLQIVFDCPPRWLGQFGYTSQMTDWKPRYYYTWDWTSRLVQIGVWDDLTLERGRPLLSDLRCTASLDLSSGLGSLWLNAQLNAPSGARLRLSLDSLPTTTREIPADALPAGGITLDNLPVQPWMPNGLGDQPLYTLNVDLLDVSGALLEQHTRTVGFKHIAWLPCEGAPDGADPWICAVNGQPVFLQGVNWTPIRPNFADCSDEDYRARIQTYRDLGLNVLRVWGGAFLEKAFFYEECDRAGLLVWQEFPLSSSGAENWPPEDERSLAALSAVARSYITRRQHHACLLCWCGGNELQGAIDGGKVGIGKPVDLNHPLIARFAAIVAELDPGRRFLPSSSSGPRFSAEAADFGKGLHWDVHGPWKLPGSMDEWRAYWREIDSLFNSEVGAPGASPAEVIRATRGDLPELPGTVDNPLWRRTLWWIEWPEFVQELGREPASLDEFVAWSQSRQAEALHIVSTALKSKFPRCGGVIFWMGHDSFPCTTNTSLLDFYGKPKPAALTVGEVFKHSTNA